MTLSSLIAEARAVRSGLIDSYPQAFGDKVLVRSAAVGAMDRIIYTLNKLAASPYASGIETALRVECGGVATLEEYEAEVHMVARMGGGA